MQLTVKHNDAKVIQCFSSVTIMLIILSFLYLYLLYCICCFINLYCMYFRGPHGRLALPKNKANLLTYCRLCHTLTPMSMSYRRLCNAHSLTEHTRYVFRILRIIFCLQPQSIRLNTDKDLLTLKIKSSWNTLCSKQTI